MLVLSSQLAAINIPMFQNNKNKKRTKKAAMLGFLKTFKSLTELNKTIYGINKFELSILEKQS
jgi:hypothetical protein